MVSKVASPETQTTWSFPPGRARSSRTLKASIKGWVKRADHSSRLSTNQQALHFNGLPKPSPRPFLLGWWTLGRSQTLRIRWSYRRALVADRRGAKEGSTVNQNCWLPRSSCTSFKGIFRFPKSNSGRCSRWAAFSSFTGGRERGSVRVS